MKQRKTALTFTGHLVELRSRFIRSAVYIAFGTIVGWVFYGFFFQLIGAPLTQLLRRSETEFLVTGVAEGFLLKMQISFLVGLILSLPLVSCEGWGFLCPALTRTERRSMLFIAPFSIFLFVFGVVAAYLVLPLGFVWLAAQNPPNSRYMPSVGPSMVFILKMCFAFGLVFQMPVVLMFLGKIGVVNATMMKARWKEAIVVIAVVTAIATPSNDALSMILMCLPMTLLYAVSIVLVSRTGRKKVKEA